MLGGGYADEPEVDQVAQCGHEGVEEQAEEEDSEELPLSILENVVSIFP